MDFECREQPLTSTSMLVENYHPGFLSIGGGPGFGTGWGAAATGRGFGAIAKCGGGGLGFKVVDGGGAAARGLASAFSGFGGVASSQPPRNRDPAAP
jgi:hypothetical protein